MDAGRILRFALDFIYEYEKFEILKLLSDVETILGQKHVGPADYPGKVANFRRKAEDIRENSLFNNYPIGFIEQIGASVYTTFLPSRVSNVILRGATINPNTAISSPEFNGIANAVRDALTELSSMASTLRKLKVESYQVEDGKIAFDFSIPREAFSNDVSGYLDYNGKLTKLIRSINELSDAENDEPQLFLTSTTDPLVGYMLYVGAGLVFIQIVNGLLDISKKASDLASAIKSMREAGLPTALDPKEAIEKVIDSQVRSLVSKTIVLESSTKSKEDINEIRTKITLHSVSIVPILINGGSIAVSPESLLDINNKGSENETINLLKGEIKDLLSAERELRDALKLHGNTPLYLEDADSKKTTETS